MLAEMSMDQPHITYQFQWRRCGKPSCKTCRESGIGHGPYWFGYYRQDSKLHSMYVGKNPPAGMTAAEVRVHERRAMAVAQRRVIEKGATDDLG